MKSKRLQYISKLTMMAIAISLYVISGMYIKINIPPVPFSTLTLFTMLSAMLLGKYLAPLSFIIYITMGLCGLPVFAGALSGPAYVFQPSFGYLIGFVVSTFVVGLLSEKITDTTAIKNEKLELETSKAKRLLIRLKYSDMAKRVAICFIGLFLVYLIGVVYFSLIQTFYFGKGVDFGYVIVWFVLVFIPSDTMWILLASFVSGKIIKALRLSAN